jgi:acetylornithine deacetylase/succinyl-diaminopimelate desuccinylase-like protein
MPNDSVLPSTAAVHLARLAREPRPTGSAEVADARTYCARTLTSLGYRIREHPFEYSAAVGEYGTPAGGLVAILIIGAAWMAALGGHAISALGVLLVGFASLALGGRWVANKGVLALPLLRRRGINLEARRGHAEPELWLVAHLDSKSQPIPLLVRAAGIVVLVLSGIVAVVLAVSALAGHPAEHAWAYVGTGAVIGALPVLASVIGRSSPGAVDNASGVATVLCAAALLPSGSAVGVLITDAEELGLAGARAWCAETMGRRAAVLNCDGVDDTGELTLMWTRPRAPRLERAIRDAAALTKETMRVSALVPGVLVDSLAFSDAGLEAVTLSRGSLATLGRIHTRGDNLEHLDGRGIAVTATVLARAATTITERG